MNPGYAFWLDQTAIGSHLHIVLSRKTVDGKVLVVGITTKRDKPYEDHSCVLSMSDHDDLKQDSWVKYDAARLLDSDFIEMYGRCTAELGTDVLARLHAGAAEGGRLKLDLRELLSQQGLIDHTDPGQGR